MQISIIAAVAQNGIIGNQNKLIWYISADLKRFKKITSGHPLIMGRKTYESLPIQPLPKRTNIVISRSNPNFPGAIIADSPEAALAHCPADTEIFISGGSQIYEQFLPLADKLYITVVHHDFEGDATFPEINFEEWTLIESQDFHQELSYSFKTYIRK